MGALQGVPAFAELTLLDLSLPGTHDSLSYDLSLTVSDAGIDDQTAFADLLHNLGPLFPGIEDYIRQQAQTHGLNISSQLSAGMRFIDARVMRESGGSCLALAPSSGDG